MAEFKIDPALTDDISNLRTSGKEINNGYAKISSDDVKTLATSLGVLEQHAEIKKLLDLYRLLLLRDALDLDQMVLEAKDMDATIAASQKS